MGTSVLWQQNKKVAEKARMNQQIPIIIPAYEPDEKLILLLEKLKQADMTEIIIVDDGFKPSPVISEDFPKYLSFEVNDRPVRIRIHFWESDDIVWVTNVFGMYSEELQGMDLILDTGFLDENGNTKSQDVSIYEYKNLYNWLLSEIERVS